MAGRLSISFLLSDDPGPLTSPSAPPAASIPANSSRHDDPPPYLSLPDATLLPRPSVFGRSPPVLFASNQLVSATPRPMTDSPRFSSHRYEMSDLEPPRSSQSTHSYESSQRPEYDHHRFQVPQSPNTFSHSPVAQGPLSYSPPLAFAHPTSCSPATSFNVLPPHTMPPTLLPLSSHRTITQIQTSSRGHPTQPQYVYSQSRSRPSSSTGSYAIQAHSPFEVRSRSYSDPDSQHRSVSDFGVSYHQQLSPSPPPLRISRSPTAGGGLEALVQAATQERRRLSNESTNVQETRPRTIYSPPSHSPEVSYTRLCSAHGPPYNPEFRSNATFDPPHKRRRSSGSQSGSQVSGAEVEERPILDRSSFMRISHIASGYHPQHNLIPSQPLPPLMTETNQDIEHHVSPLTGIQRDPNSDQKSPEYRPAFLEKEVRLAEEIVTEDPAPNVAMDEERKPFSYHLDGLYTDQTTIEQYPSPVSHSPAVSTEHISTPIALEQDIKPLQSGFPLIRPTSVSSASSKQHQPPSPTPEVEVEDTSRQDVDNDYMTVDMEFDLAANKSESGFDMELDVEDELLRLVDDELPSDHRATRRRSFSTPITDTFLEKEESSPPEPEPIIVQQPPPEALGSKIQRQAKTAVTRKKQPAGKAISKPRQPAKPRGKTTTKIKNVVSQHVDPLSVSYTASGRMSKPSTSSFPLPLANTKGSGSGQSRSTSAVPPTDLTLDAEDQKSKQTGQDGDRENVDDKVYCVCRSQYEEGRVMIACDRCDEWYHMYCLGMSDLEVDLVDQFICPICVENNRHLSLGTTYKQRCFAGLKNPNPSSASACHKPARGAFSKYCSEECGVSYMQTKIDAWATNGGNKVKLWDSVKDADQREGVVIAVNHPPEIQTEIKMEVDVDQPPSMTTGSKKSTLNKQKERELTQLRSQLDRVVQVRDVMKTEMEVILWRATLTQLASERAEDLDECGWDQRLCMDDEEYTDYGASVLESYGDAQAGDDLESNGEWWCRGKKKCDRHAGWQKLRSAEVAFEQQIKETALSTLATNEREIRKRIEDITDPQRPVSITVNHTTPQLNGRSGKVKINGITVKNGKKRKAAN